MASVGFLGQISALAALLCMKAEAGEFVQNVTYKP